VHRPGFRRRVAQGELHSGIVYRFLRYFEALINDAVNRGGQLRLPVRVAPFDGRRQHLFELLD
jgi:hypothetical protein